MVRLTICKCFFLFHNPVPSPFIKDFNFANLRMEPWGQGLGSVSWEAFVSPPAPHSIIHIQLEMNSVYNVDNTVFVATFSQIFQDFFTTFWPKSSYGKEYAESVQQCDQCSVMSYVIFQLFEEISLKLRFGMLRINCDKMHKSQKISLLQNMLSLMI